jgi:hypothetical protein
VPHISSPLFLFGNRGLSSGWRTCREGGKEGFSGSCSCISVQFVVERGDDCFSAAPIRVVYVNVVLGFGMVKLHGG